MIDSMVRLHGPGVARYHLVDFTLNNNTGQPRLYNARQHILDGGVREILAEEAERKTITE